MCLCYRWARVVDAVFACLAVVKRTGLQASMYDELVRLSHLHFRFRSKNSPVTLAQTVAANLLKVMWRNYLGLIILPVIASVTAACAKRTSATASVERRRREPDRAVSPE